MNNRRQAVSPTADIAAKKIFKEKIVTKAFIETFLGLKTKEVTILNGDVQHLKAERKESFSTLVDVLALLDDGTEVIIEIQVAKQKGFIQRTLAYACEQISDSLSRLREEYGKTHQIYAHINPIYVIAITENNYLSGNAPFNSFSIRNDQTNEPLEQFMQESEPHRKPFQLAFLELKKYNPEFLNEEQRMWFEFFMNRSFTGEPSDAVQAAERILDKANWTKEELLMLTEYERQVEAHYGEIQTAVEDVFHDGKLEGRLEVAYRLIKKGMSNEEVSELTNLDLEEIIKLRNS